MKLRLVAFVAALGIGCQVISGVADLEVTSGVDGGSDGSPGSTDGGADALVGDAFVSPYASGTVYYLPAGKTVTLHLNGGPPLTVTGAAASSAGNPFKFPDALAVGTDYSVTADPSSDAACWVKNGTGTFTGNLADLDVRCVLTATATSSTGGTLAAGNPATPMTDFPGSPAIALSFTTDRPGSDVLLSLYIPAVQSEEPPKHGKTFFAIDVDGTTVQTVERSQWYYGGEGQSVTALALTNLAAGAHTVKARWRAETSPATVLGASPAAVGPNTLDGPQVTYNSVLSAIVLDSMSTFDGIAKPVTTGTLFADAGALSEAGSGFVTAASLPLDGLAGRKALALFQTPEAVTSSVEGASFLPAGSLLRLALDTNVLATAETVTITPNSGGVPTLDRAQSIAAFAELSAGTKPSLAVLWESLGRASETGTLAAGSWLGAAYFKASAKIVTAPYTNATYQAFTNPKPTIVDGLTTTLIAPRAGKALVVFQGAYLFTGGGFNHVSEATVVHTTNAADGGAVETPILYSYLNNSSGYGQGATMVAVVDVPKGTSTMDVRMRSRVSPGVAPAYIHTPDGDPLARSTLGVMFIE
jgi:hypothetical protein